MPNRSKSGSHRRWNKRIRAECPGGSELLDSIRDVENMLAAIAERAEDGDELAGHKLGVAQVASDKLMSIRAAMIDALKQKDADD